MLLDRGADDRVPRVAHAVMAGEPASLLGKQRNLAVVQHDRKPVFVDRRLLAGAHVLLVAVTAVPLPLFAVEAHIVVHAPLTVHVRFPLEAEVEIIGVVRGLHLDVERAVLSGDRRRLEAATFDDPLAARFLAALVAGGATPAPLHTP